MSSGGAFVAGSIIAKLLLDKTGWDSSTSAVAKDQDKLREQAKKTADEFMQVGRSLAVAGAAITAGLGLAVNKFTGFDDSMQQSISIMGDVSASMKKDLVDAAKEVAKTTTFSAEQAGKAFYYLTSAGLTASESIQTLPVVAKFAQAGMFDLSTATSYLADAQSALGLRIKDDAVKNMENMARVADVLTKANIMSNASIEQFAESLTTRAGSALRLVNKSVEEGAAALMVYADQGVKGAEAGTRLDIVLRDLQTRGIKSTEVMEKYGVVVYDSAGKMRNLADIIADLEKAFAGASDEKKRAILIEMEFQDRSVASLLNLVGMSSKMRDYEKALKSAGGATEEVAKKQLESLKSQFILTKNAVDEVGISLGAALAPAMRVVSSVARELSGFLSKLIDDNSGLSTVMVTTAGVFGVLLAAGGGVLMMMGSMSKSIIAITTLFPKLAAGISLVTGALGVLVGTVVPIVATLGLLVLAIKQASEEYGSFQRLLAMEGEKRGWLADAWDSVTAAILKTTQGIDIAKIGWAAFGRALQETAIPAARDMSTAFAAVTSGMDKATAGKVKLKSVTEDLTKAYEALGLKSREMAAKELATLESAILSLAQGGLIGRDALSEQAEKAKDLAETYRFKLNPAVEALLEPLKKATAEAITMAEKSIVLDTSVKDLSVSGVNWIGILYDIAKSNYDSMSATDKFNFRVEALARQFNVSTNTILKDLYNVTVQLVNMQLIMMGLSGIQLPAIGEAITKNVTEKLGPFAQAWADMVTEMARGWSDAFIKMFGLSDALIGESTKHNQEYFEKAQSDLDRDYKARKKYIEENVKDEGGRKDQLYALDEWYEAEKTRIRADEEKSRKEHADNELTRQNSLWTKVKGVFGSAVETMLTTWTTTLVTPILASIVEKIIPSIGDIGKAGVGAAGSLMKGVGDVAGAGAKAVTSTATSVIDTISGVVTAVASVLDLFKGPQKQTDVTYWLKLIKDLTQEIHDSWFVVFNWLLTEVWPHIYTTSNASVDAVGVLHGIEDRLITIRDTLAPFKAIYEDMVGRLKEIVSAVSKVTGAASGAVLTSPQLVMTHGTPASPEYIIPSSLVGGARLGAAPAVGRGSTINVNLNGPLVSSVGLSRRDLEDAGEQLWSIIEFQAKRHGYSLA